MDHKDEETVLDLCDRNLKILRRGFVNKEEAARIKYLHIDKNELVKIDNLGNFNNLIEITASHNKLCTMAQVAQLKNLRKINFSNNHLSSIQGMKDLIHLKSLNLSHNKIKDVNQLEINENIEEIDISYNLISFLSNMKKLQKLKKLNLHNNAIQYLNSSNLNLPKSIETLNLSNNKIEDLTEIRNLLCLMNLNTLSLEGNPCIEMTEQIMLRGEWLYCQGKGRNFSPGEHDKLAKYLAKHFPLDKEPLLLQDEKLIPILKKANEYKRLNAESIKRVQAAQSISKCSTIDSPHSLIDSSHPTQVTYQELEKRLIAKFNAYILQLKKELDQQEKLHILQLQVIKALTSKVKKLELSVQALKGSGSSSSTLQDASTQTGIEAIHSTDEVEVRQSPPTMTVHRFSRFLAGLIDQLFNDEIDEDILENF